MRPKFHFTAPRGWINDPHGITYRDGRYHAFYQYVPDAMVWGPNCHWGHAAGSDLISLEHLPVVLAPGDGDDGIWTGSIAQDDDDGGGWLFYTSTRSSALDRGRIRVATPDDDDWIGWSKRRGVLLEAPHELDVLAYRDPFVFRDGEQWRMLVGAGLQNGTAAAVGYSSPDLKQWTYEGLAAQRSKDETDPVWMGAMWECPQLFEVDGRHVLVTSVWDADVLCYAGYGIGTWEGGQFVADTWGQLTYGRSYYAPSFFRDAQDRPCLTLWFRGVHDDDAGWTGAHSVPHVLTLDGNRLVATPHPDLDRYLGDPVEDVLDTNEFQVRWTPEAGDQLAVSAKGLQLLRIDAVGDRLAVFGAGEPAAMPFSGGEVLIIVDGPIVEISTHDGILGTPISLPGGDLTVATARGLARACRLVRPS